MWTDEMILRLKAYVDASRWYQVFYRGDRIYGVEPRRPEYGDAGWAGIYLSEYDDCPPDPHELDSIQPNEITVLMLVPCKDWLDHNPTPPPNDD